MPTLHFTANLQRHVATPDVRVTAHTVAEALEAVFRTTPILRGYLLDDQGAIRRHVSVFVDGEQIHDRSRLSDAVSDASEIWVMQALSGG